MFLITITVILSNPPFSFAIFTNSFGACSISFFAYLNISSCGTKFVSPSDVITNMSSFKNPFIITSGSTKALQP